MNCMEKILIVDDSILETQILKDILSDYYEIFTAKTGKEGIEKAKSEQPVLILLDVIMPGNDGFEILKELKSKEETKDIPVIFLTSLASEIMEERGLLMGAVDYIKKPYKPNIVKARVKIHIKMYLYRKTMENELSIDGMTGIYNRRDFEQRIKSDWKRAINERNFFSFLIIDIDYFKQMNDTYGHPEGDYVLRKVAHKIKDLIVHFEGYIARYGGEEFAVILYQYDTKHAYEIAELLRKAIFGLNIPNINANPYHQLTISIGGSTMIPQETDILEDFIKKADKALYQAKANGRNCVIWSTENQE